MTKEIIITEDNFREYFRDARKHQPERGEVMACFSATGYFSDGNEKRQIIDLLITDKMIPCTQVMRKLLCASEIDSYRVPRRMAEDLLGGLSREKCAQKEYKYTVEMFYYTKPEHIPRNDPHWQSISLLNLDEFLDKKDNGVDVRAKIVQP